MLQILGNIAKINAFVYVYEIVWVAAEFIAKVIAAGNL